MYSTDLHWCKPAEIKAKEKAPFIAQPTLPATLHCRRSSALMITAVPPKAMGTALVPQAQPGSSKLRD